MPWSAIASVGLGLLGNRSAKKQAARDRRNAIQDLRLSLPRLRESAELANFNPLSALMAGGAGTFGMGLPSGSAAPLASQSVLSNAVRDVATYLKPSDPDDDVRREMNKTNLELAKLKLEKAQAGNAGEVVARTPTLGRRPMPGSNTTKSGIDFDANEPGRDTNVEDVKSKPGYFVTQSRMTLGEKVYTYGDDHESDPLSAALWWAQAVPQIGVRKINKAQRLSDDDLKTFSDYEKRKLKELEAKRNKRKN